MLRFLFREITFSMRHWSPHHCLRILILIDILSRVHNFSISCRGIIWRDFPWRTLLSYRSYVFLPADITSFHWYISNRWGQGFVQVPDNRLSFLLFLSLIIFRVIIIFLSVFSLTLILLVRFWRVMDIFFFTLLLLFIVSDCWGGIIMQRLLVSLSLACGHSWILFLYCRGSVRESLRFLMWGGPSRYVLLSC